ncbi:formate dehydrogenase subunit gamma [Pelagibius sp. CAU 1746]|uniref:formate dehydrogenase subunit gamma n=1 Tax=Pelagibius sp. CAU 1746 TaxID=3140370 RepID=UPI00325C07DD
MTASVLRTRRNVFSLMFGTLLLLAAAAAMSLPATSAWAQSADQTPSESPTAGNVPGNVLGNTADSEFWRAIRRGEAGSVSIPNAQAGQLIQSEGDNWRAVRNGPVTVYGAWAMLGIVAVIAVFFAVRGRIRIDAGPSGSTIERFNMIERTAHWITAISFIVLALTGLNILYGRHVLLPILGPDIFAAITIAGKYAHNFLSFAFMVGVVMIFFLWVGRNIPKKQDLHWLAVGGGLFKKGVHPPAGKFNAGQKLIFWSVILGGVSISLSGVALLFPFQFSFFAGTFEVLNIFGFGLPTDLTMMQEMQLSQLWHGVVALILIAIIIGHIYIGSLGMEGAFEAMGSGQVDLNWAKEHHALWVKEVRSGPEAQQPAE